MVGAGPAGSSLALRLARAGVRVTVLDAATFPRSKPCGDCLSPGAGPLLEELGVRRRLESIGAGRLGGWRMRTPGGTWFRGRFGGAEGDPPPTGFAVPRRELDALLLAAAREAGARVREGMRVSGLLRRGGRVCGVRARDGRGRRLTREARLVIGADGLRSVVARRLAGVERGPRPRLALVGRFRDVAPSARGDGGGPAAGEMRLGRDGCLGLAPLGRDRWNASLVVPAGEARAVSRDRHRFFREHLAAYGVSGRFETAELTGPLEITGPFQVTPRRSTAPGALLVGDAAGYFDPLTGQGIYRALATARAATGAALSVLGADGEPARAAARLRYARDLREIVSPGRRMQRLIDGLARRPALIEAAGRALRWRPGLADLLVDVTGDRLAPAALADPRRLARALRAA